MSQLSPALALALAALLGAVFGSFATAAAHRLPRRLPLVAARSACPGCHSALGWRDLVPLLSWLTSGGRCRHCGAAIGWRYPATEAATAGLFVLAWTQAATPLLAALLAATAVGLVILAVTDIEAGIIPDAVTLCLAPIAVAFRVFGDGDMVDAAIGGAVALMVGLLLRYGFLMLRKRQGLGLGDVKFLPVAGVYVGLSQLAPFLVLSGALGVGFGLAWRCRRADAAFPFGPALAGGLMALLLWPDIGAKILRGL